MNDEKEYVTCKRPDCTERVKKKIAIYVGDEPHCSLIHAMETREETQKPRNTTFLSYMSPDTAGPNGSNDVGSKKLNKIMRFDSQIDHL